MAAAPPARHGDVDAGVGFEVVQGLLLHHLRVTETSMLASALRSCRVGCCTTWAGPQPLPWLPWCAHRRARQQRLSPTGILGQYLQRTQLAWHNPSQYVTHVTGLSACPYRHRCIILHAMKLAVFSARCSVFSVVAEAW